MFKSKWPKSGPIVVSNKLYNSYPTVLQCVPTVMQTWSTSDPKVVQLCSHSSPTVFQHVSNSDTKVVQWWSTRGSIVIQQWYNNTFGALLNKHCWCTVAAL
eukprot:6193009-Heterocapsa_arctica.AAC.1